MELKTNVPRFKTLDLPGGKWQSVIDHYEDRKCNVVMKRTSLTVPIEKWSGEKHGHDIFPYKMTITGDPIIERGQDNSGGWRSMVTIQGTKKAYDRYRNGVEPEEVTFTQWDVTPDELWIDVRYIDRRYKGAKLEREMSGVKCEGARLDQIGDLFGIVVVTPNTPEGKLPTINRAETLAEKRSQELSEPPAPVAPSSVGHKKAHGATPAMGRML